ncbi:MAG: XRE family transcriptional regulator [Alphaproteobacteria bacterium]|nr:MAG: XRE family transcriptional regulator [Alphaproteobacteria bacterium]
MTSEPRSHAEIEMEQFADRLRELREARGLTQARLAELLEVSPRVYNRWETGAAAPRLDTVVKLADILEVSLDELVGRTEPEEPQLRLHNPKLHKLYREIDRLSDEDQQALVILLDSLVKRSQMGQVLAG